MTKRKTPAKPDLREYEEEAVPFDDVIKRLAKTPPARKQDKKPAARQK